MFQVKGINQNGESVIEHWSLPLGTLTEHLLRKKFKYAAILNQDNVLVGGVRFDVRRLCRVSWIE